MVFERELEKQIAKLKRENAGLKSELTKKADTNHSLVEQMAKLESDFRICEKNADAYYDQLTKAKEILQLFLKLKITPCASGNSINMFQFENVCNQAEQFLKEIEK